MPVVIPKLSKSNYDMIPVCLTSVTGKWRVKECVNEDAENLILQRIEGVVTCLLAASQVKVIKKLYVQIQQFRELCYRM
jgi:hypothetical protein